MILLTMFWEFFKVGLFAVGGGLATIPFLYDIAERYTWLDASIIPDMIAISESTPGPIGINMATYAGYNAAGIVGSLVATAGLIAPAIILGMIIIRILDRFMTNRYVEGAFRLIRPAATAMIAAAGWTVFTSSVINLDRFTSNLTAAGFAGMFSWKTALIFAASMALTQKFKKLHPIVAILGGAALGMILRL